MLRFELPTHASYVADLDNIIEACRRGADLTGNLLGFARKRGFQRQLVDINEIIRSAVDTAERSRVRQRPRFELDLHPSLPTVEGDRNQLRQVVTNLLSNAQDATGPEGVIRLSTSCQDAPVSLRTTFPDLPHCTFVVVRVADTGAGMDDATVARAIEPFFTTKPVGQGIGLGLSMVYGTVRAHRGAVVLDSEQGHGTTVTVWLPCAPTRSES
ncbi:MAG: sensor histidine kinase [Myxococcota bacterium]